MREEPNVRAFGRALREHGLLLLVGVDERLQGFLADQLNHSDICYSASIVTDLNAAWDDGPEAAVLAALESYLFVVREWLDGWLGPDSLFPWDVTGISDEERFELYSTVQLVQLRDDAEIVAVLASAALEPDTSTLA